MLPKIMAPKGSIRTRRAALFAGCAIALALTARPAPVQAQLDPAKSFQGVGTVVGGDATINQTGTIDTITVNTPEAIINWAPLDTASGGGPIVFLPDGRTGSFVNSANLQDFTVLNRIVPTDSTRGIRFDGTVQSRVNGQAGGSVWFYSPGGIIAGQNAVFDVGNLMLTANDIDTSGGLFGVGGEIRFRGAADSSSAIEIMAGAQIIARNQALNNAYVALVAPRIVQRGTVNVNGSVAYVAAEEADIRISSGLFDINIITGTSGGVAIDHSGTTTGPGQGFGGTNGIYLAAVAKNDAVTMLVTGTLGYSPASSASVDNGIVVLAAGYDVQGGIIADDPNGGDANITIGSASFTSDVIARASNDLVASPAEFSSLNFSSDARLHGDNSASLGADTNESVSVGGSLLLGSGRDGQGGDARLFSDYESGYGAFQGDITIAGNLIIDASATGADEFGYGGGGDGDDALGGFAELASTGGYITVGGDTQILADATGGAGGDSRGDATGGTARVSVSGGGDIQVNALAVSASAFTEFDAEVIPLDGGSGTGGTAEILLNGGTLTAADVRVSASAAGGVGGYLDGEIVDSGSGGDAAAGTVRLTNNDGTSTFQSLSLEAFAQGGGAGFLSPGGNATGGTADVSVSGAGSVETGGFTVEVGASAGFGSTSGATNAGDIDVLVDGGTLTATSFTSLRAFANGEAGDLVSGAANGGTIAFGAINGGTIRTPAFDATAGARTEFASDVAGAARGGSVEIFAEDGGSIGFGDGFSRIDSNAVGDSGDIGGSATGGTVRITASGGDIDLGSSFYIGVNGVGGLSFDGAPASATGGSVDIQTESGGRLGGGELYAEANGRVGGLEEGRSGFGTFAAPPPSGGDSGIGIGGAVNVTQTGGTMTFGTLSLSAIGTGGDAFEGRAGDGVGGTVLLDIRGGTASIATLGLDASGFGGSAGYGEGQQLPGFAGNGFGGDATVRVRSIDAPASLGSESITVVADGTGGEGYYGFETSGTAGGIGTGGDALFDAGDGASANTSSLSVSAVGEGGGGGGVEYGYGDTVLANDDAGDGGEGFGGNAVVRFGTGEFSAGNIEVDASGQGGASGDFYTFGIALDPTSTGSGGGGGAGTGGFALVEVGAVGAELGGIRIVADGTGASGGRGPVGGSGGNGTGGEAVFRVNDIIFTPSFVSVSAAAFGGRGSDGLLGDGGNGGDAFGGAARFEAVGEDAELALFSINLDADAEAGSGGAGASNSIGGAGGDGGSGTGGTVELFADLGAITLNGGEGFAGLASSGSAGSGGRGGDGFDVGNTGGAGGDGGDGTGGTVRLSVIGGSIVASQIGLVSEGYAGSRGSGGIGSGDGEAVPPIPETFAADGATGRGSGGLVQIVAEDIVEIGALGAISLGVTEISAEGYNPSESLDTAGRIQIDDRSIDPDGSIRFASLDAHALGDFVTEGGGFYLTSTTGAIMVQGAALISTTGPIDIQASDTGGLIAGGDIVMLTPASVAINHSEQPTPTASTIEGANIFIGAAGNITANPDSLIRAAADLELESAGGSITAGGLAAGGDIDIFALQDVAVVSGVAGEDFSISSQSGGVAVGSAVAGVADLPESPENRRSIGIEAVGDIHVGQGTAALHIGLSSLGGDVVVGDLDAGGTVALFASNNVEANSVAAGDLFYVANSSSVDILGPDYDPNLLIGITPAAVGGNVTVAGPIAASGIVIAALSAIDIGESAQADGDIYLDAGSGLTLASVNAGGDIELLAGSDIGIGSADSAGGIFIGTGDGSFTAGTLRAGNALFVNARHGITIATADVTGDVFLSADRGAVTVTTDLRASGIVEAFGQAILLNSLGNLTIDRAVATDGDIDIVSTGDLLADDLESVGDIRLTSTAASVTLADVTTRDFQGEEGERGEAAIDPQTGNSAGNPGPGDIIVDAAQNIVVLGTVDARRNVSMNAGSQIRVDEALVNGIEIRLASDDIEIENSGRIGGAGTVLAHFTSTSSTGRTRIGGTDRDSADYQLSDAELDRVFTNGDIVISVPGQSGGSLPPEVFLDTLSLTANAGEGGRHLGAEGRFAIETPGSISVVGAAEFTAMTGDNRVQLLAGNDIRTAAESGSIRLRGEGDTLAGRLELTADMIIAGSADAIDDVAAASSTDAIDDRLGTNDGATNDGGYFQAGSIAFSVDEGLFIQNSGANSDNFADRRGFTANSVRIATESSATRIVINGRVANAGGFATGGDTIDGVDLSEESFDPRSTINGCLISGGAACSVVEPPPPPPPPPPQPDTTIVRDFIEGSVDADEGEGATNPTALIALGDFETFGFEPLIDEPVTGAGNDDLWFVQEDDEDEDEECTDATGATVPCDR